MSKVRILVNNTPPSGYRWQLVAEGGTTLKSGTTDTEVEAYAAANAALTKLQEDEASDEKK
jgi:hypothetical protein